MLNIDTIENVDRQLCIYEPSTLTRVTYIIKYKYSVTQSSTIKNYCIAVIVIPRNVLLLIYTFSSLQFLLLYSQSRISDIDILFLFQLFAEKHFTEND